MIKVSIDISDFKKKLDKIGKELDGFSQEALQALADALKDESQSLVPVDTGKLKASVQVKANKDESEVSYNTPYALRQHEEHSRRGKYLETPLKQNLSKWEKIYGDKLAKLLS